MSLRTKEKEMLSTPIFQDIERRLKMKKVLNATCEKGVYDVCSPNSAILKARAFSSLNCHFKKKTAVILNLHKLLLKRIAPFAK